MGSVLRHLALAIAWASALLASGATLLYLNPEVQAATGWLAMASAFIPYGLCLWALATAFFLAGGRGWWRVLAFPTLIALIVSLGWLRPYWPQPTAPVDGPSVRVMASNVFYGKADPGSVADAVREADPDVLLLLEASDVLLDDPAMRAALTAYPHRVGRTSPGWAKQGFEDPAPTLVLSKTPLTEVGKVPSRFDQPIVRVDAGGTPLTLVAAHPMNMVTGGSVWEREGRLLRDATRPHVAGPLALVGDFNATPEQLTLRELQSLGLELGAQEAGAGWQPTYNGGIDQLPALIPIDHVLTNDRVTTTAYRTMPIAGSDHHAIVADLVVG